MNYGKSIKLLKPTQHKPAAVALTDAFLESPLISFLFPDKSRRYKDVYCFYSFLTRYGLKNGKVYATEKINGAAISLPPERPFMNLLDEIKCRGIKMLLSIPMRSIYRILYYSSFIDRIRKDHINTPHYYLLVIGIKRDMQEKGLGGSILQYFLNTREKKYPVYLETVQGRNVNYYRRFGFQEIDSRCLSGSTLKITSMTLSPKERSL